ncbi:MAG: permease [Candidatus Hadarchaeum sp.]|uniref:permease n=1 Tax=Candidatus Hadarchaeum sp. TaxID=2883567 RepID=UPI003D0B3DDB
MPRKSTALAALAWALLLFGLFAIVYPKATGQPLTPVYDYGNLSSYNPILIPFVYVAGYLTRAWGAFLFAFMLGGFIEAFVPREKMKDYLSSKSVKSYVLAALFAPVLTVCSCAMIPIFGGIIAIGAGIGPALSFLLMAPAANFLAILFTSELISPLIAGARFGFAFLGAILIGYAVAKTPWGKAVEEKFGKISAAKAAVIVKMDFREKSMNSLKEAYALVRMVLPYLLIGVAAVSFIDAYMPRDIIGTYFTGALGVVLGAAIGVPLYTPTLVEVFFVKALIGAGMSASAALAFLLGAPMSSIPSMIGVSRLIGWKTVGTYAVLAVLWAAAAGFLYMIFIGGL